MKITYKSGKYRVFKDGLHGHVVEIVLDLSAAEAKLMFKLYQKLDFDGIECVESE